MSRSGYIYLYGHGLCKSIKIPLSDVRAVTIEREKAH